MPKTSALGFSGEFSKTASFLDLKGSFIHPAMGSSDSSPIQANCLKRKSTGMMPEAALLFTRWVAGFSITTVILGSIFALYLLQISSSSFVPPSLVSFGVLWLTNLISMVLNAVYWFIRRAPKWLSVTLLIQAGVSVVAFIPLRYPDYFFG